MTTVSDIRAQIAELQQSIASHQEAEKRRDGKRFGESDGIVCIMLARLQKLRAELLEVATWVDLADDAERDAYLLRFFDDKARGANAAAGREYLFRRLLLARDAKELEAAKQNINSQRVSWMTKAKGFEAELRALKLRGTVTENGTSSQLCIVDFLSLIDKSTTNAQLQIIVQLLEECFRGGAVAMRDEDWPIFAAAVSAKKQ